MRIVLVTETFYPKIDGVVTRLLHSIDWLTQCGHEILVIAPDMGIREYKGAAVAGLPARPLFLYPELKVAYPRPKVGQLIRSFQPDIVHVVNPAILGIAGIHYGRRGPWSLVASYHAQVPHYAEFYHASFLKPALWSALRLLHNRAQLNLCTSSAVQEELKDHGFQRVEVWRRGVAVDQFHPDKSSSAMRARLTGGHPERTLLLYVGRLAAEKSIESLRDVLLERDDLCLALVGDGPHRKFLEQHFEGLPVIFTGFLQGDELASAYASSDLFVFPSTSETLGLVILEAMASGLPVVAAHSLPSQEQIAQARTGWLYKPGDIESLVQGITYLSQPEVRRRMGAEARKVSVDHSWDAASAQLLGYYELALNMANQPAIS